MREPGPEKCSTLRGVGHRETQKDDGPHLRSRLRAWLDVARNFEITANKTPHISADSIRHHPRELSEKTSNFVLRDRNVVCAFPNIVTLPSSLRGTLGTRPRASCSCLHVCTVTTCHCNFFGDATSSHRGTRRANTFEVLSEFAIRDCDTVSILVCLLRRQHICFLNQGSLPARRCACSSP